MNGIGMTKMMGTSLILATILLSTNSLASAAAPDNKSDYFGRNTAPAPSQNVATIPTLTPAGPHPMINSFSTPEQWFEGLDDYIGFYSPNEVDKYTISQNFNQESERVMEFCKATGRIAKNYRILSKKLKELPIPNALPEAKSYRDLCVHWYSDAALVYEDMIRPRPAARTKEELDSMIKDVTDRSEGLKQSYDQLAKMDSKIRQKYSVHPPKYDDALFQYYDKAKPH